MLSMVMLVEVVNPVINNMTELAINSLAETTSGDWELICYVHGGKRLELAEIPEGVRIIEDPEQLSVAVGYNRAVGHAAGDMLCLLHNDIIAPCYGWDVVMRHVARQGNIAFPMIDETGGDCEVRGVVKTEPWQTSSSCYMVSREVWDELGGLDEDFEGMHGEDIDFYKRAEKAGHKLVRCDPVIIHHRGVTRSFVPDRANKPFFENWCKYNIKHNIRPGEPSLPRLSVTADVTLPDMANN